MAGKFDPLCKGKGSGGRCRAGANIPFNPNDVEVTAVVFSKEMLNKAKEAAVENGIQAKFILFDIESLSFSDDSFDTIRSPHANLSFETPSAEMGFQIDTYIRKC